jgi:predicted acyl esterase
MTIEDAAFDPGAERPASRSAGWDPERPFLFEALVPRYPTRTVRSVFVPMRDGVRLSSDFHVPCGGPGPWPVVLTRTPYDKRVIRHALAALLPEQGFVYAVQDVRGRYESEGAFVACTGQDREDGYDTLEWLVRQPWCNGRVGAIGSSYGGETAAKLLASGHPALRTAVLMFDASYDGGLHRNGGYLHAGVNMLRMLFDWCRHYVPTLSCGPPPHVDRAEWFASGAGQASPSPALGQPEVDVDAAVTGLPLVELMRMSGAAPNDFERLIRRSVDPSLAAWHDQGYLRDDDRTNVPVLHVTGPQECGGSPPETFRLFRANGRTDTARRHQVLWFTPAAHSGYYRCSEHQVTGAKDFGDTRFPYYRRLLAWFARWLRDEPGDIDGWPRVEYFVSGINRWRGAPDWPPSGVRECRWFLDGRAPANSRRGGGRLVPAAPAGRGVDTFVYDPARPYPSAPPGTPLDLLGAGYGDRADLELRDDVLVYTSDALEAPLAVCGPARVELSVSTSTPDTDVAAVLVDVHPDGRAINVMHGIARLRWRQGFERPAFVRPGEVVSVVVDLWHVSHAFLAGHRLRLEIAGSFFPYFDRNLNTGGDNVTESDWRVASTAVFHGDGAGSALVLPVVDPDGDP